MRRIERAEGRDIWAGRSGNRAQVEPRNVDGEAVDRRAVQVLRDRRGRARDGSIVERVVNRMHGGLHTEGRQDDDEGGHDKPR